MPQGVNEVLNTTKNFGKSCRAYIMSYGTVKHDEEDMQDIAPISVRLAGKIVADSSYSSVIVSSEQTLSDATLSATSAERQPSNQIATEADQETPVFTTKSHA